MTLSDAKKELIEYGKLQFDNHIIKVQSKTIKDLTQILLKYIGLDTKDLKLFRKQNYLAYGNFKNRLLLSEKVLPINVDPLTNKILLDDIKDTQSKAQTSIQTTDEYGVRQIPEKLVRDNIPKIIEKQAKSNGLINYRAKTRVANSTEFLSYLKAKFEEESIELMAATTKQDILEELVDVLVIIESIPS